MPSVSVKHQVLDAVQRLPDDINFKDVNEEIALLSAVAEAEEDIKNGNVIGNDEMKARLDDWLDG